MNWDESVEGLLQKYADESQTAVALHRRSYYSYKKLTTCFNLPVIVLSCLSGSLQFLSKGYPDIEQYIVTGTASSLPSFRRSPVTSSWASKCRDTSNPPTNGFCSTMV